MRRDAKASSVGSTMHRGKGFGRLRALVAALAALLLLALVPAFASAAVDPQYLGAFGPDGTEATSFERAELVAVDEGTGVIYVGDRQKQVLYKFDSEGNPLNWGGSADYILGNEISVPSLVSEIGKMQVAVDPETHVVYITLDNKVRAFESNGEPHFFSAGPGEGTSEIPGAKLTGVSIDVTGNIYISDATSEKIRIYRRSGALLTEFAPKSPFTGEFPLTPGQLAIAPDGSLYVRNNNAAFPRVFMFEPSSFPVSTFTTYPAGVALDPLNFTRSVAVDPTTSDVYLGVFINNDDEHINVFDEDSTFVGTLGAPNEEGEFTGTPLAIAVNGKSGRVYAVDSNLGNGSDHIKVFETFTFPVVRPAITATSVIDLNLFTATLRARVNPNTLESTYHFEYGLEDCDVSACTSTPEGTIAPAHKLVNVAPEEIEGLQPGTTYHYRVVATNAEGTTEGPDRTFTTPRSGLGFNLADERAWEMVSPPTKFGGKITQFGQGVMQAAADGNGVAYETVTSIEPNPDGNRAIDTSTVLARRASGGDWSNKDITPPHAEVGQLRFGGDYKTFSPNLERALLEQPDNTLLSPEASEETPYLRENTEPGTYRPLVTGKEGYANVPPGTVFGGGNGSASSPVAIRASDADLDHLVLRSQAPLVLGAAENALYLWEDGQLAPVSQLPVSEGGAVIAGLMGTDVNSEQDSIRNAVSAEGSRVFWIGREPSDEGYGLYVRDIAGQQTGRLDLALSDASGEGARRPIFQGASADGTVAFFSDTQQLTADGSAPSLDGTRDLYRCKVGPLEGGVLGCSELTDLSVPLEGSGERAEFLGTIPTLSDDGSRLYFVARAILAASPNELGESPVGGEPNLYFWEEGEGMKFVATLSEADQPDWGRAPSSPVKAGRVPKLAASGSPDGRYLAFMSERSLTGYDNRDAVSEESVEEVFRYDSLSGELRCISCNPSGASPVGQLVTPGTLDFQRIDSQGVWSQRWVAAVLPTAQETEPNTGVAFHRPRVVHDNGRVFFNAVDSLVSADSNGEWDVYQWEPIGVGDCTSTSEGAAIARSAGGCVSLISSGTGEEEASFIDAGEGGNDVFFITSAQLSVTDEDEELDVYDARVDGVPATLPVINECLGEACQAAPNPPNDPTPASAAFKGSGNVPSERCPQGKRRVTREGHSRCVAKKHKRKKHSHKAKKTKRANNNRRAGR